MAHDAAPPVAVENSYKHLIDPTKKWYKNSRLIKLNLWILLLFVTRYLAEGPINKCSVTHQTHHLHRQWLRRKHDEYVPCSGPSIVWYSSPLSHSDGLQLLTQWEEAFNFPHGSKLGLLGAIQNIGSLACLPFSPYLCDILGRKRTIFLGAFIIVAGAIIQTASQSVNMFIGARFMRT